MVVSCLGYFVIRCTFLSDVDDTYTETEDEAGRDTPVATTEYTDIYKEGVHVDANIITPDGKTNALKRARITPVERNFDGHK